MGTSLVERGQIDTVRGYLDLARRSGTEIVLPTEFVTAAGRSKDLVHTVVPATAIPPDQMGLDIGPKTASRFTLRLATAKIVFWNGPMGVSELPACAEGTRAVAQGIIDSGAYSVIGGGDTTAAVRALGFADSAFGYLSTGGGASLECVQGKTLPGLAVLQDDAAVRLRHQR